MKALHNFAAEDRAHRRGMSIDEARHDVLRAALNSPLLSTPAPPPDPTTEAEAAADLTNSTAKAEAFHAVAMVKVRQDPTKDYLGHRRALAARWEALTNLADQSVPDVITTAQSDRALDRMRTNSETWEDAIRAVVKAQ